MAADRLPSAYARIYRAVERVPKGRVATYGQIARLSGLPGHARQVGYALGALPDGRRLPWHRVVNARGAVSPRAFPGAEERQRTLLEREGIRFGPDGRLSLKRHLWIPR